jgi:hypothetical protein
MTVYLNGFETTSIRLDTRNADDGRLVIQLSPRQVHPGRNWLHIAFDLHMTRENCRYRYFEEAWAEISTDLSMINLAHVVSLAPLDLHYMPSYLVIPNDLSADLFVLPAAVTHWDLTTMVRMAAKLGTYSASDTIAIQAVSSEHFDPEAAPSNVIAIGSPQTNTLIGTYDTRLPQPLGFSADRITPVAGRDLALEEQSGQAAYLEVLVAPWSRSGALLIIAAHSPEMLETAVEVLPTGGRRMSSEGNVAVVTTARVTGLSLGGLAGVSLSPAVRNLVAGILAGTFLLIALVGVWIAWGRRRNSRKDMHNAK